MHNDELTEKIRFYVEKMQGRIYTLYILRKGESYEENSGHSR